VLDNLIINKSLLSSVNANEVIWKKNKTKEEEEDFEKNILIVIHYF
jgi:hypothetical protein